MEFDYFYGPESEQFTFYRIPKLLITSPTFKKVSDSAKLLYGLMLDRMSLSIKNGWIDEENRAYIFFTTNDVIEQMNCGTEKATKMFAELDCEKGIGLIERKKQGQGKPAIVYLKKFYTSDKGYPGKYFSKSEKQDFGIQKVQTFGNRNSSVSKSESAEFRKAESNNTEYNNTDNNGTDDSIESYQDRNIEPETSDAIEWMRNRNTYRQQIKRNIEYDVIAERFDKAWLDEIVELMTDVVCSKEEHIRINKRDYPHEIVKSRFLKINSKHIEYIYFALKENTTKVRNIRAFLITTIYRSFDTADNWFNAKVNYDMSNQAQDWGDG